MVLINKRYCRTCNGVLTKIQNDSTERRYHIKCYPEQDRDLGCNHYVDYTTDKPMYENGKLVIKETCDVCNKHRYRDNNDNALTEWTH